MPTSMPGNGIKVKVDRAFFTELSRGPLSGRAAHNVSGLPLPKPAAAWERTMWEAVPPGDSLPNAKSREAQSVAAWQPLPRLGNASCSMWEAVPPGDSLPNAIHHDRRWYHSLRLRGHLIFAPPVWGRMQSESLSDLPFRQDCKALASQGEGESFFSGGV